MDESIVNSKLSWIKSNILLVPYFGVLVSFLTMILSLSYLLKFPYDGFTADFISGKVEQIDRLGPVIDVLDIGDLIHQIDGRPFIESFPLYESKSPGDEVLLTISRGGELIQRIFTLQTPPLFLFFLRIAPLALAFLIWSISSVIFTLHARDRAAFLFLLPSQTACVALSMGSISFLGAKPVILIFNTAIFLLVPQIVHFHLTFPARANLKFRSPILLIFYLIGIIGAAYVLLSSLFVVSIPEWLSPISRVNRVTLSVSLLFSAVLLISYFNQTKSDRVRGRIRVVTLGGSLGLLPITVFSLLPDILVEQPLLPYHISFLLLGIIPLAYGYAILNDPVISSQGKIARSASNVLVFALTGGLFLILLTLTHRLLPDDAFQDPILLTVVFLFFAALYTPAKKAFNQLVNRAFYGGWYDYHSLVIRSTRKLSRTKNKDRLISSILDIMTTMHFPAAAFFLPVGDHLRCQGSLGTFPERISAYTIPRRGALAEHLRRSNQPAWNSRLRQVLVGQPLSDDEKSLLLHKPPGLWVPLVTNGSLRGLLFLESQFAEEWMSSEDMVILATLGTLAALTSENVALLDALERQLALTEQARAELQESRLRLLEGKESERLHLARELHDGPIQDLHGVRLLFAQASSPAAATRGEGLDEKILTIIHGLREICTQLRPPALTYFGLEAAMRSLADQFTASHPQMTFDIAIDDGGLDLSEQASLALYRIYQEALNNIDQHAGASRVSVRYAVSRSGIQLEVRDDGSGFRVPASLLELARQGHLGLLGASERAESIGGALQIVSAPGQGTQILVNVPLNGASEILKSESSPADLQGSRQTSARV